MCRWFWPPRHKKKLQSCGNHDSLEQYFFEKINEWQRTNYYDGSHLNDEGLRKLFEENIKVELEKKVMIELCWNDNIFVRYDESNHSFIQVLLIGLKDTSFENGLFLFDVYLGEDYPRSPLIIKHVTHKSSMSILAIVIVLFSFLFRGCCSGEKRFLNFFEPGVKISVIYG